MKLKKLIGKLILKVAGWTVANEFPSGIKKAVITCGPHTSNWDAVYSLAGCAAAGVDVRFAVKKEAMFFPLNILLRFLGAITIDRKRTFSKKSQGTVDRIAEMYHDADSLHVMISPEGTRAYSERWKTGFYFIAQQAKVPIVLAYLDYAKKEAGFGDVLVPSGDVEADIVLMKNFFRDKKGKYPEQGIK